MSELCQPLINIGLLGHVANGKSSLVRSITGEKTARGDSRCMQKESREMTIQIGYSNAKIYQCGYCPQPDCYTSIEGSRSETPPCTNCGAGDNMKLVQFVSFVDCFHPNTMIKTINSGSKKIVDLNIGDLVVGDNGEPRKIINILSGKKEMYKIIYDTHEFTCTEGHLLVLKVCDPVDKPVQRGEKWVVFYYYINDDDGLNSCTQYFDSKKSAQIGYDLLDKESLIIEVALLNYLQFPDSLREKCYMFYSSGQTTKFQIQEYRVGRYVGIEIDGNGRFLLADGLIVHNCPGHRMLMRNMISGSAVMDGAILVVDSNKDVPQVQTLEHLTAAEIIGIDRYVTIVQNKIDLLLDEKNCQKRLHKNYEQIKEFVRDTGADLSKTPVIPTCMSPARQINLKLLLQYLVERAKPREHLAYQVYPIFIHCVRSFDVNKPCPAKGLKGGVIGGTIMSGILRIGDILEIRPGYRSSDGEWRPLFTTVRSLYTGTVQLQEARPGGLIGIGTDLDPALTRGDTMVGMCAGYPDQLPAIVKKVELKVYMLKHSIGHDAEVSHTVNKLKVGDSVQLAIGAATVVAKLIEHKKFYTFELVAPMCPVPGQSIPISKIIDGAWTIVGKAHLAGYADVRGENLDAEDPEDYHLLLERTLAENKPVASGGKLVVPPPQLTKDGGAKLLWINFRETCVALNREKEHIAAFFNEELATAITLNSVEQMVIHGKNRYQTNHIQSILAKYITGYIACPTCRSAHTILQKEPGQKYLRLLCKRCGSEHLRGGL